MMKNRKWIKEETLESSENGKYIFGISDQPFLSLCSFSVVMKKIISGFLFCWELLLCLVNSYFIILDVTLWEALTGLFLRDLCLLAINPALHFALFY